MRVFVSSTYRNLTNYREVLRLALQKSGHEFLGMEYFAAQDSPPLQVCLDELDIADVYLGIVGTIYGSSPPDHVPSYTELEYLYARELGIPCIMLIISEDAQVRAGDRDVDPKRIERLESFKRRVLENHTVDSFLSEHEAAWKALAALSILEARDREVAVPGEQS